MKRTFYKVDKQLLKRFEGDATPCILIQNMWEFANDRNYVAFNISRFSEDTGMSRPKVMRGIEKLVKEGLISKTDKQTTYGKAIYYIGKPKQETLPPQFPEQEPDF